MANLARQPIKDESSDNENEPTAGGGKVKIEKAKVEGGSSAQITEGGKVIQLEIPANNATENIESKGDAKIIPFPKKATGLGRLPSTSPAANDNQEQPTIPEAQTEKPTPSDIPVSGEKPVEPESADQPSPTQTPAEVSPKQSEEQTTGGQAPVERVPDTKNQRHKNLPKQTQINLSLNKLLRLLQPQTHQDKHRQEKLPPQERPRHRNLKNQIPISLLQNKLHQHNRQTPNQILNQNQNKHRPQQIQIKHNRLVLLNKKILLLRKFQKVLSVKLDHIQPVQQLLL